MWSQVIRRDVQKQLAALEKMEKEEEMRARRRRRERMENEAEGGTGNAEDEDEGEDELDAEGGRKKKKKKKEVVTTSSRNLSDDVRKKMSDAVANQAGGAKQYSWMLGGAATAAGKKSTPSSTPKPTPVANPAPQPSATGGFIRPFISSRSLTQTVNTGDSSQTGDDERTLTVADLMFVVNQERGHGGGRGAARHWTVGY
jgi:hypothetical protein